MRKPAHAIVLLALALASCTSPPQRATFAPTNPADLVQADVVVAGQTNLGTVSSQICRRGHPGAAVDQELAVYDLRRQAAAIGATGMTPPRFTTIGITFSCPLGGVRAQATAFR